MPNNKEKEIERAIRYLRSSGQKTVNNLLAALLIWLFGVLIFIPLAESLNWQTRVLVSILFFLGFSLLIFKSISDVKKLIDVLALFPAKKYGVTKELNHENTLMLFKYLFYIICSLILYGLYSPFLMNFHPAVNGIILIAMLILIFFLILRIFSVLLPEFLEWLMKS